MVKRLLILICLLSVPIASFSQQSNCPPPRAGSLSDLPFQDGEVLLYSLSYNWGGVVSSVAEGSSKLKFNNSGAAGLFFNAMVAAETYTLYELYFIPRAYYNIR